MKIISPCTEVYPYLDEAKRYLQSGAGANVADFAIKCKNPTKEIRLEWLCEKDNVTSYKVEYGREPDFTDAVALTLPKDVNSVGVYNLYKDTLYHLRVTAYVGESAVDTAEGSFRTTALGPRVMSVDGIYNVRDLGGYVTESGKKTAQGLIYRGGSLTPADVYDPDLTEDGKRTMAETMRIRTEIDLRTEKEAGIKPGKSIIPNATLRYISVAAYADIVTRPEYRELFSALSNGELYPVYLHCTGGADRTATVSFLLNALLGVPKEILIQDYEFTTFSAYGERNSQYGEFSTYFKPFLEILESFDGNTLAEKTYTYMRSIGVTEKEIEAIKDIMLI